MSEVKGVKWNICKVRGCVTAVDPGCLSSTPFPKDYQRKDVKVGMNLAHHESDLPAVVVRAVGEDYIKVYCQGQTATIYTGAFYRSPRKGLSYAYSDVDIKLE